MRDLSAYLAEREIVFNCFNIFKIVSIQDEVEELKDEMGKVIDTISYKRIVLKFGISEDEFRLIYTQNNFDKLKVY